MKKRNKELELELKQYRDLDERYNELDIKLRKSEEKKDELQKEIDNLNTQDNNFLRGMILHLTSKPVNTIDKGGNKHNTWVTAEFTTRQKFSHQFEYNIGSF